MGLQSRKLLPEDYCDRTCYPSCPSPCWTLCPSYCPKPDFDPPPSPPASSDSNLRKPSVVLTITVTILATTFLALFFYLIYTKYYARRSNPTARSLPEREETHGDFLLDEEHGPVIDHPIWYIRTVGLQPSIINSITVCKYKRGDGLLEGTECSVCLSEFQEDETLRLLPKCSHAFHIPCIDTWLRSHTNCPLCRAPIVANTARLPSTEVVADGSGGIQEGRVGISEESAEFDRDMGSASSERRSSTEEEELSDADGSKGSENLDEEDGIQPLRRSVSLHCLEASKVSQAVLSGLQERSNENPENPLAERKEQRNMEMIPKRVAGHESLLRLVGSSSIGRTLQDGPIFLKRSISCGGKFSLSRRT